MIGTLFKWPANTADPTWGCCFIISNVGILPGYFFYNDRIVSGDYNSWALERSGLTFSIPIGGHQFCHYISGHAFVPVTTGGYLNIISSVDNWTDHVSPKVAGAEAWVPFINSSGTFIMMGDQGVDNRIYLYSSITDTWTTKSLTDSGNYKVYPIGACISKEDPYLLSEPVSPNYNYYNSIPMEWVTDYGPNTITLLTIEGENVIINDVIQSGFTGSITTDGIQTTVSILADEEYWVTIYEVNWSITYSDGAVSITDTGNFQTKEYHAPYLISGPTEYNNGYYIDEPIEYVLGTEKDDFDMVNQEVFVAIGGDESFTLTSNVKENLYTISGYNVYMVQRNGALNTYAVTPIDNLQWGFTAPKTIVMKDLDVGDIITIMYGV
jgi:hypothetical protein